MLKKSFDLYLIYTSVDNNSVCYDIVYILLLNDTQSKHRHLHNMHAPVQIELLYKILCNYDT